jgi:hypothetical protein
VSRLLVTGGCGFLGGAYLLHVLGRRDGTDVFNFDALTYAAQPSRLAGVDRDHYQFGTAICRGRQVRACSSRTARSTWWSTSPPARGSVVVSFVLSNVLGTESARWFRALTRPAVHISTDEVGPPCRRDVSERAPSARNPMQPQAAAVSCAGGRGRWSGRLDRSSKRVRPRAVSGSSSRWPSPVSCRAGIPVRRRRAGARLAVRGGLPYGPFLRQGRPGESIMSRYKTSAPMQGRGNALCIVRVPLRIST